MTAAMRRAMSSSSHKVDRRPSPSDGGDAGAGAPASGAGVGTPGASPASSATGLPFSEVVSEVASMDGEGPQLVDRAWRESGPGDSSGLVRRWRGGWAAERPQARRPTTWRWDRRGPQAPPTLIDVPSGPMPDGGPPLRLGASSTVMVKVNCAVSPSASVAFQV